MTAPPLNLERVPEMIERCRMIVPEHRSLLIAISGIDASGKGYLTSRIAAMLQKRGWNVAAINVDGWLNLPDKRFDPKNPALNFYERAIRFDEMFDQLILPLKRNRSHDLIANFTEETASAYRPHRYHYKNVDIILLEGIFLLKQAQRRYFDLSFWVECTFETALGRALQRGQEGLPPDATYRAYRSIYFPAQQIHFLRDNPRSSADFLIPNDPAFTSQSVA